MSDFVIETGHHLAAVAAGPVPFVAALFIVGAVASYLIAGAEDAAVKSPSVWELIRAFAAGWFVL